MHLSIFFAIITWPLLTVAPPPFRGKAPQLPALDIPKSDTASAASPASDPHDEGPPYELYCIIDKTYPGYDISE